MVSDRDNGPFSWLQILKGWPFFMDTVWQGISPFRHYNHDRPLCLFMPGLMTVFQHGGAWRGLATAGALFVFSSTSHIKFPCVWLCAWTNCALYAFMTLVCVQKRQWIQAPPPPPTPQKQKCWLLEICSNEYFQTLVRFQDHSGSRKTKV